jgi:hypothetical protein
VSSVIAIAGYYDVGWGAAFGADLGPEGVGEAWSHIRNRQAEFVLESRSNCAPSEGTGHPVAWEVVCPDTVISVRLLVVVYKQLFHAIIVYVNIGH